MRCDLILAGVGGQGVLTMAAIIGNAAVAEGRCAKLSEVHGMAQRGGAVLSHLRLSDRPVDSDLIMHGAAHFIVSMEPIEALRNLEYLSPEGMLVTAASPVQNIPDYPDVDLVLERIRRLPHAIVVEAQRLATEAGDPLCMNTVMVGAVADLLPLKLESLEMAVAEIFARKGSQSLEVNRAAFKAGRAAAQAAAAVPSPGDAPSRPTGAVAAS